MKNNNEVNINKLRKWLPEFKQAKSKFNVINPDSICEKYGADI